MTQNIIRFSYKSWKVDKEYPIKQVREKYFLVIYFLVLHICALQKYVNLCFSVSGVTSFAAVAEVRFLVNAESVLHNNM